ncbi:MAG: hypothetical protein GW947_00345 [Candidatus Pacebacteria bacterium]
MQSPFHNADLSVERASRIITGLLVALFLSVDGALAVGWQTGELKERVLIPSQVLAEYGVSKLERWAEADEPQGREKNVNVTVTGGSATSVTTTVNGETKTTTTTKTYAKTSAPAAKVEYNYQLSEPSYSPPAWFVENSAKSQAEFDAAKAAAGL